VETLDLRAEPESGHALATIAAIRGSGGQRLVLLTRDDPSLLMASLNLQFRDALAWETRREAGFWRTLVRPDVADSPASLVDRLVRDHRRMDEQLARALRLLNAGEAGLAQGLLREFARGLRLHLRAEDDILAPALGPDPAANPLAAMLHEHAELVSQLEAVEAALAGEVWELEAYVAMLSGTLAKHEHREETNLLPVWAARLEAVDDATRECLERSVILGG
jgi:iron-sulfur cluster repair protein YtfE (RIC family)